MYIHHYYPNTYQECLLLAEELSCLDWEKIKQDIKDDLLPALLLEINTSVEDLQFTKELAESISRFLADKHKNFIYSEELKKVLTESIYSDVEHILKNLYYKATEEIEDEFLESDDEIERRLDIAQRARDMNQLNIRNYEEI